MTLDALRIGNFKAFADTQRVPLRPITLVYGANSAGKSSILHALALAHHGIETGDLDVQRTQIGGESIDLGGFRQYVYHRDRARQVDFAFEIAAGRLSGRVAELLRQARYVVVEIGIGTGFTADGETSVNDPERSAQPVGGAHVERFTIEVDGAILLSMSARRGAILRLDRLNHGHPVFRELFRGLLMLGTTTSEIRDDDLAALGDVLDALVPNITARAAGLFPRIEEDVTGGDPDRAPAETLVPVSRGRRREDLAVAARLFLPKALRDLVSGLGGAVEDEIRRLRYLGPLRSYPPRHLAFSQHYDLNWFAGGGFAWDVVRNRADVRQRVNAWLGDPARLKTPYELRVQELLSSEFMTTRLPERVESALTDFLALMELKGSHEPQRPDDENVQSALQSVLARLHGDPGAFDSIGNFYGDEIVGAAADTDALVREWFAELTRQNPDVIPHLVLVDKRSGTTVSHRDVGIGVSQVLPVLVSAFGSERALIAIEQPEIHLHPALQADLGDLFLEAALGAGGNRVLIETHSEHLLLRIMRRLRETYEHKLPDGMPEVAPDQVMVLFVEADGPKSIVREMPLNERGELVKAWPGGFFEEGLREIF